MAVLALDLGATKIAAGWLDVRVRGELPRQRSPESEVRWLTAWLKQFTGTGVSAVVVASAAEVDSQGCIQRWPNRSGWVGVPLGSILEDLFGGKVRIVPDGSAAALAEAQARGGQDLLYVGLGTGVCAGVVRDGEMVFDGRWSVDLGHTLAEAEGPPCTCGMRGCVQAVVSAPAVLALASDLLGRPTSWDEIQCFFPALEFARLRERISETLARAALNAARLFGVQDVVIGGRVPERLPTLTDSVTRAMASLRPFGIPVVTAGRQGADAALLGAIALGHAISSPVLTVSGHD